MGGDGLIEQDTVLAPLLTRHGWLRREIVKTLSLSGDRWPPFSLPLGVPLWKKQLFEWQLPPCQDRADESNDCHQPLSAGANAKQEHNLTKTPWINRSCHKFSLGSLQILKLPCWMWLEICISSVLDHAKESPVAEYPSHLQQGPTTPYWYWIEVIFIKEAPMVLCFRVGGGKCW